MNVSDLPDWNKIGRRIGKRLRDILHPPRDTGPSPEERRAERLRDVLKGFAYFDTFDELLSWSPNDVDPVQQANTPLLPRAKSRAHDCAKPSTNLILCHDYRGGYHDYENARPGPQSQELYSCEYLQYVETFIYFSHKLVCCPPPSWTNLLHRNGVRVLGTFLVEPQTPVIERILESEGGNYTVATQLAALADKLGFDGWLLNIEKEFPNSIRCREKLIGFMTALKKCLGPQKLVVWYDALTVENDVEYQNGLTSKNAAFACQADALFTNYKWDLEKLAESQKLARQNGICQPAIYFGVDVWAQDTNMPGPPRITYPRKGGGGTNTGLATRELASEGFSTAMFAPAWTFEHFPHSPALDLSNPSEVRSIAKAVDRCMWEGSCLPDNLHCDCREGRPHHASQYRQHPIVTSASEHPAGSSSYLHSTFTRAFAEQKQGFRSCLGSQAILPHLLPMSAAAWEASEHDCLQQQIYGWYEGQGLSINIRSTKRPRSDREVYLENEPSYDPSSLATSRLCLFKVNMIGDGSLQAIVSFCGATRRRSGLLGFYAAYQSPTAEKLECKYQDFSYASPIKVVEMDERNLEHTETIQLRAEGAEARLVEVGVFCNGTIHAESSNKILHLNSLIIRPGRHTDPEIWIGKLSTAPRGEEPTIETRLSWAWGPSDVSWPPELPWSVTTGPFSHFTITVQGNEAGSAYCLEFPMYVDDFCGSDEVQVSILGHLFGGGSVRSATATVMRRDVPVAVLGDNGSIISDPD